MPRPSGANDEGSGTAAIVKLLNFPDTLAPEALLEATRPAEWKVVMPLPVKESTQKHIENRKKGLTPRSLTPGSLRDKIESEDL